MTSVIIISYSIHCVESYANSNVDPYGMDLYVDSKVEQLPTSIEAPVAVPIADSSAPPNIEHYSNSYSDLDKYIYPDGKSEDIKSEELSPKKSGIYIAPKFIASYGGLVVPDARGGGWSGATVGGALAVGYIIPLDKPLRIELEYSIESSLRETESVFIGFPAKIGITHQTQRIFVNIFNDYPNASIVTPYIGVGIGLGINTFGMQIETYGQTVSEQETTVGLAVHTGFGLAVEINDSLAVDWSIRVAYGDAETMDIFAFDMFLNWQTFLGLRYTF